MYVKAKSCVKTRHGLSQLADSRFRRESYGVTKYGSTVAGLELLTRCKPVPQWSRLTDGQMTFQVKAFPSAVLIQFD